MPIEIGMLSSGAFPFKGVIDEVGIWNRVLTDAEISALFNGGQGKTLVPGASPSPRPSPQGTLYYKLAESEAGLQNAPAIPYSEHPTVTNFAFKDTNWGSKQIWVQFIGPNNTSTNEHISVDVIEPEPTLTSLDCTMDISRKDLKLTLNGSLFGGTPGKVTANAKETQILAWNANQITATIKPTDNLEDGKLFKIVMTRADGKSLPETTCLVNTSVLSPSVLLRRHLPHLHPAHLDRQSSQAVRSQQCGAALRWVSRQRRATDRTRRVRSVFHAN
jgi:hypothetical protein